MNKTKRLKFDTNWSYSPAPESIDYIELKDRYGLFIDGNFTSSKGGNYFDTINPANEEKLSEVSEANEKDVDKAVQAARQAYEKVWSKMKPSERGSQCCICGPET